MNSETKAIEVPGPEADVAQGWSHHNGHTVAPIEKTLDLSHPAGLPTSPMFLNKKAKRKDDGPVEIICRWIVEHQIGLSAPQNIKMRLLIQDQVFLSIF
jgi:acyl-CoA-dependent ceramide synthase